MKSECETRFIRLDIIFFSLYGFVCIREDLWVCELVSCPLINVSYLIYKFFLRSFLLHRTSRTYTHWLTDWLAISNTHMLSQRRQTFQYFFFPFCLLFFGRVCMCVYTQTLLSHTITIPGTDTSPSVWPTVNCSSYSLAFSKTQTNCNGEFPLRHSLKNETHELCF